MLRLWVQLELTQMKKKLSSYSIRATNVEYKEVDVDDVKGENNLYNLLRCVCDQEDHYILAEQQGCNCWCHGEELR